MMDVAEIRRLARWMRSEGVALVEYDGPGVSIRLASAAPPPAWLASPGRETVMADAAGTLLTRHPLAGSGFAEVGDAIAAGAILGLVQSGPLLVPVTAPVAGTLVALLADHDEAVAPGTPLFVLATDQPAGDP